MAKRATKKAEVNYAGVQKVTITAKNVWASGVKYFEGDTPTLEADVAELLIKNGQAE